MICLSDTPADGPHSDVTSVVFAGMVDLEKVAHIGHNDGTFRYL